MLMKHLLGKGLPKKRSLLFMTFLLIGIWFFAISQQPHFSLASPPNVRVHFIDVGQGDSVLIEAPGADVLVDGGPTYAGSIVLNYLTFLNITHLRMMVATHMHEDHIGGLITILQSTIQVDEIIINNESYTTQTYSQFIALASSHTLITAQRGQVYTLTSTANLTVFNPVQPLEFTDQNENSVVLKLQVATTSFLLEGDASSGAEQSMIAAGLNLHADILKVGHHGSKYATTNQFLDAVQPKYAVISCSLYNQYGFPTNETLQRLADHNVTTYATYNSGTIVAETDGTRIALQDNPVPIISPGPTPLATTDDYDGLWHTTDFAISLLATGGTGGVNQTNYRTDQGPVMNVSINGQPLITTESFNNTLEYWSVDNSGNEEAHHYLTGVKLDKTPPIVDTPILNPAVEIQPNQSVTVSVNATDTTSGMNSTILYYTLDNGTSWSEPITMEPNATTSLYEGMIPGQPVAANVGLKIVACDYAGNEATRDLTASYDSYHVVPEFPELGITSILLFFTCFAAIFGRQKKRAC